MSKQAGGPVSPGQTWGASDTLEEFFPGGGKLPVSFRAPIPLSERKPGPEDCDERDRCWCWDPVADPGISDGVPSWEFCEWQAYHTHWLPASVKYLPARVEG